MLAGADLHMTDGFDAIGKDRRCGGRGRSPETRECE